MIRALTIMVAILVLQACKHPLIIVGEGDINELNGTGRGCTLEQFNAGDVACTVNETTDTYDVRYEPVPREGWRFVGWEGLPCSYFSVDTLCEFLFEANFVQAFDAAWPDFDMPPSIAVFEEINPDADDDGVPDADDVFPNNPTEWEDTDLDGVGDNADAFPRNPLESTDSDGDGVGDNSDRFPDDPLESADVDCDGIGDNSDDSVADNVTTIQGDRCVAGVHLYILADGYTAEEQNKLTVDGVSYLDFLLEDEGIAAYVAHWNVHVIQTISNDSGIDPKHGIDTVDSAFNSGFGCFDVARLICTDEALIYDELHTVTTDAEAIPVLMVNSEQYGGSGGDVPVFSIGATEVALHEMGHSFASLGDEYVDEAIAPTFLPFWREGELGNLTQFMTPEAVPWSLWIEDHNNVPSQPKEAGVGIFEGGYYHATGFYRPTEDSRMRSNGADFGPVNSEAWILASYRVSGVVREATPAATEIDVAPGEEVTLRLELHYDTDLQRVSWEVNGVEQLVAADSNSVNFSSETPGAYLVEVAVDEGSGAVRNDPDNLTAYNHDWLVRVVEP